jgi:urease accessory protein UreE
MAEFIVRSVVGNIRKSMLLSKEYRKMKAAGKNETMSLSRTDMQRMRLRRRTDSGSDVGIILQPDARLRDGDVLVSTREKFIVVRQLREKVLSVKVRELDPGIAAEVSALVGHAIGNRHRPIAVDGGTITFPIMADSELEMFEQVMPKGRVRLKIEEQVFQPSGATESYHDH